MPTIAYIANQFPSPVEPYVMEEIMELGRRGFVVIPCSARQPERRTDLEGKVLFVEPLRIKFLVGALWLGLRRWKLLGRLMKRVILEGNESSGVRLRTLLHTWLGAYYALLLRERGVEHIHVHHGYFASWMALVAARLLGISFSMTLHGSDLLLHPRFLETKLKYCKFCITISEFNRRHILEHYPECEPDKVLVQRLGVSLPDRPRRLSGSADQNDGLVMLAAGRLHSVKDHAFLVNACRLLKNRGIRFVCWIAGEGEERRKLEDLICNLDLQSEVQLLGHLSKLQLRKCYEDSTLVVLTSRSEGLPVVLMEAMALEKIVLAPAITGIPELVCDGKTGFLYNPGSLENFVANVELVSKSQSALGPMRAAARQHVFEHFNRERNLTDFGKTFLKHFGGTIETNPYENPVLQQI
jgi:colanic acid/amylovoran biosynthesis glycosyltransferase